MLNAHYSWPLWPLSWPVSPAVVAIAWPTSYSAHTYTQKDLWFIAFDREIELESLLFGPATCWLQIAKANNDRRCRESAECDAYDALLWFMVMTMVLMMMPILMKRKNEKIPVGGHTIAFFSGLCGECNFFASRLMQFMLISSPFITFQRLYYEKYNNSFLSLQKQQTITSSY